MLNNYIDLTILRPDATYDDVVKICETVLKKGYRSACIPPLFVENIKNKFKNIKLTSVVAFPLGHISLQQKIEEYRKLSTYCDELDIVISISLVKTSDWKKIENEIYSLSNHVNFWHTQIKLIIETCYLTKDEIHKICNICNGCRGIYAIKTSTGFGKRGATVEDIKLIKKYWKGEIKASGGIKTKEQALELIKAGATIIGTSTIFED
jgi:deoxyribose-phosphate aldolase